MIEENAIIESTMLGFEDRGIFTFMITVSFAAGGQGFGGYALGGEYTNSVIKGILKSVGVDNWEDLKGTHVRVRKADYHGKILEIGHFMKDQWFNPKIK